MTTILYLIIEGVRNDPETLIPAKAKLCKLLGLLRRFMLISTVELNPSLVDYFVTITARLRWDEANELPQTRVGGPCPVCFQPLIVLDFSTLLEIHLACLWWNKRS